MNISGIYKIQSKVKPEKIYIGSAVNMSKRWWTHLQDLQRGNHHNKILQNHYNKYGASDLQFSILLGCDKEDLLKNEQYFIDSYKSVFNICKIAGSQLGVIHSEESKEKQRNMSQSSRDGIRGKLKGRHPSKETCIKLSKITNEIHEYIINNMSEMSQSQIATLLNLHQSTISKHLKKYGKR